MPAASLLFSHLYLLLASIIKLNRPNIQKSVHLFGHANLCSHFTIVLQQQKWRLQVTIIDYCSAALATPKMSNSLWFFAAAAETKHDNKAKSAQAACSIACSLE